MEKLVDGLSCVIVSIQWEVIACRAVKLEFEHDHWWG